MAAIALVAMDAADGNPCELFEIGDDGTERMAVDWTPRQPKPHERLKTCRLGRNELRR